MSESLVEEAAPEFPIAHVRSALAGGKVRDWLVAQPPPVPLTDPAAWSGPDLRGRVVRAYGRGDARIARPPSEHEPFAEENGERSGTEVRWRAVTAREDGLIHVAGRSDVPAYVALWAYTQVVLPAPLSTTLTLTTLGPLTVWINGERVLRTVRFYDAQPGQQTLHLPLGAGTNEVLVRLETVATGGLGAAITGDYALACGLHLADAPEGAAVVLPTSLTPPARRTKLAEVMAEAYILADVYHGKQKITLHWPATMQRVDALTVRLQTPGGRIYAEAAPIIQAGSRISFGAADQFPGGAYELLLIPQPEEYYVQGMRVERRIPLTIVNDDFSTLYYGSVESRRHEALQAATKRADLWAEVARAALGQAPRPAAVEQALHAVRACSVGLWRLRLALAALDGLQRRRPCLEAHLAAQVAALVVAGATDHGGDESEDSLLGPVCRLLAAERLDAQGADAARHRAALATQLRRVGLDGLRAWQDHDHMADALAALACVVEFGADGDLADLAAATLDRLCLDLALTSLRGVVGGARSAARTAWLKNGRLGPLTGVCRLLWGMGAWGAEQHAQVALAICAAYSVPEVIAAIAVNRDEEALTRVCYAPQSASPANLVVYRTPDYLLCAALDDRAGTLGEGEVAWQALFGPDAVVTMNYPAHCGEGDAAVPNYWRGDRRRPRVAQWRNVLVALYAGGEEQDSLGFTHVYLPTTAFDEVVERGHWLFARKDAGYLALSAAAGWTLLREGTAAGREVRSPQDAGRGNVWVCLLGRAAVDGSFAEFMERVAAAPITLELGATPKVHWRLPGGPELAFSWSGLLTVDGVEQPMRGFPRLDGPYCSTDAEARAVLVRYADTVMRLDFGDLPADTGSEVDSE